MTVDGGTDASERCAFCGSKLPMEQWCPIVTTTGDDGTTRVLSFCDESCEEAWRDGVENGTER